MAHLILQTKGTFLGTDLISLASVEQLSIRTADNKKAQLSQRDHAPHYVRWNLVDCCTTVQRHRIWEDVQQGIIYHV